MYLKRLEIFGFKSFAEKVVLELSPGVSAVIGPNGCGKSNIIDAIRWVLGEQSPRTLRGNRMEEVIFSGTDNRKPLNFAEVSLLFEKADDFLSVEFSQVEITRRLYRSGESEYFFNKSPCRLKDINELFMDTGVGKEVYSIVGQNRVEEIISAKPEERRELFEEASGILKYKHRKKEARRKLEEMEKNLQRVNDLIGELENQMEPLQEQAEHARKHQELKARKQEKEKHLLRYQLVTKKQRLERCTSLLTGVQEEMAEVSSRTSRLDVCLEEQRQQEREVKRQKDFLEKELSSFNREKEKIESEQKLLKEKEKNVQQKIEQARERSTQLKKRKENLEQNIQQWEDEEAQNRKRLNEWEQQISKLQQQVEEYHQDDTIKSMEELQNESLTVSSKKEGLESQKSELENQLEKLKNRKQELETQLENDRMSLTTLENSKSEEEKHKEKTWEELQDKERLWEDEQKKLEKFEHEQQDLQEQLSSSQQELSDLENRLWLLEKWREETRRNHTGVKEIWEAVEQNDPTVSGIEESLFSVVSVPNTYRKAIEAALEEKNSALLASNEEAAFKAISYLKGGQKGRASFLPLELSRKEAEGRLLATKEEITRASEVIATAAQVVKVNPRFRDPVCRLLQGVLIVDTLKDALNMSSKLDYCFTVVTLEGEAVLPGGFLRGGAVPSEEKTAMWGGEEDLKNLQEKAGELKRRVKKHEEQKLKQEKEIKQQQTFVEEVKQEVNRLNKKLEQIEQKLNSLTLDASYRKENLEQKMEQLDDIKQEEKDLSQRRENLENQLAEVCRQEENIRLKLEQMRTRYRSSGEDRDALQQQLTDLQIGYNKLKEQQRHLQEKSQNNRQELEEIKRELQHKQEEAESFGEDLDEIRRQKEEEEEKLELLAQKSVGSSRKHEEVFSNYRSLQTQIREMENESGELRDRLRKLERRERDRELEKTRLQAEVDGLQQSFQEKFGEENPGNHGEEDPGNHGEEELLDLNEEETQRELEQLKQEIEGLGQVNTGSIDELNRLNERVSFLKSQKEDLEKGEQSLQQVLDEIDQEIKQSFNEALEKIGEFFQHTFTELFGGGYALLRLTDPEDLLEAGVEIVARPPGKNLQNISLLSSGEKALTVIALIFAILSYKPAPFYFLDEIESSLDDHNINKFTQYLKKLSHQAQFILVTHRKTTTEMADLIYGITMQESGVTRVLSLKTDQEVSSTG